MKSVIALSFAAIAGVFLLVAILFGVGYLGFSNTANGFEVDIKAKYNDNRNVYDNGWKRVQEVAQVPDMYADNLLRVYQGIMEGRYGNGDAGRPSWQWIQEQNPMFDAATILKVQQNVESFRIEFQSNQTRLISIKQEYERFLTATTSGRLYNMIGGYPRIDMSKFDIVTSTKTETAFETKKDEPLKLRK